MFDKNVQLLKEVFTTIESPISLMAVKCCDDNINSPSFGKVKLLYGFSRLMFGVVSLDKKDYLEAIVNLTSVIIFESISVIQTTKEEQIQLFTYIMDINSIMARALSTLGLYGQSWNYQMLAFDPTWTKHQTEINLAIPTGTWVLAIKQGVFDIQRQMAESLSNYFYLSRHMGHNFNTCHELFNFMSPYINVGNEKSTPEEVECICYYAGILASFPKEPDTSKICISLKDQFQIEYKRNPELSVRIAETLATKFGEVAGEDTIYWARVAQHVPNVKLSSNQLASLKLNELLNEYPFPKQEIKHCILTFLDSLDQEIPDILINNLQRQRLSHLIVRVISASYKRGEYKFIVEMAFLWRTCRFGIDVPIPSKKVILVVIPNIKVNSIVYLIMENGNIDIIATEQSISLESLFQSRGEFDGSWTVVLDQEESKSPPPSLRHPDYEGSDKYEEKLKTFFYPEVIAAKLEKHGKPVSILETTWMNMPLNALISLQSEISISTLVTPLMIPCAPIKKVVVWCDPGEDLYYAHLEKDAVVEIFLTQGIEVEVFIGKECTSELFLEKYNDPNVDLIWTMCHASFSTDDPTESILYVSKEKGVNLGLVLPLTPVRDEKRLLVLNACESGMSGQRSDAMGFIGLGPSLSNEQQSVIGHLWTVDSFGASIFGILLAIYLKSLSWGDALNRAIRDMSKGNDHVREILKRHLDPESDVIRLLKRYPIDKIGYWGSAVLYE